MNRSQIIRSARHNLLDYTENFFTPEVCNDKFSKVLTQITKKINFKELYATKGVYGLSSTTYAITNPSGDTFRIAYSSGATIDFSDLFVGGGVKVYGSNFNALNQGTFTLTAVSSSYIEFTNASGVVENVTLGQDGYIVDTDLIGVDGQEDYPMPSDWMKLATIYIYGTNTIYNPVNIDSWDYVSTKKCMVQNSRLILYPRPAEDSIIILNYYKKHPTITSDNTTLTLPDDAEEALVAGVLYELAKVDESIADTEVALLKAEYEEEITKLKKFSDNLKYVGQKLITNNAVGGIFNI